MPRSESAWENGLSQTRHLMKRINHLAKFACFSKALPDSNIMPENFRMCDIKRGTGINAPKYDAHRPLISPKFTPALTHLISSFSPATASSTADMQSPEEWHPANPAEGATNPFVRDAARRDSVVVSTDVRRAIVYVVAFFAFKKSERRLSVLNVSAQILSLESG